MRETAAVMGMRLQEARKAAGLSQAELAAVLHKTQGTVSQWEAGKRFPGLEDLFEIAAALEVQPATLLPEVAARKRPGAVLMRSVVESLALTELAPKLEAFLGRAEELDALSVQLEVTSDRPLRAAQELLARAQALAPDAVSPPIDIESLANLCGVHVLRETFDDAISAVIVELDSGPVIGFNAWEIRGRRRFSVAHELGHHLLHHHDRFHIDLAAPSAAEGDSPLYDWRLEREANDFAANAVMPATMVREAFQTTPQPRDLAERFGVSPLAMGYRLVNLGLRRSDE
jgi:transcriptional regulator with XRE-family HTH domain